MEREREIERERGEREITAVYRELNGMYLCEVGVCVHMWFIC
jgi:hypothetical protein